MLLLGESGASLSLDAERAREEAVVWSQLPRGVGLKAAELRGSVGPSFGAVAAAESSRGRRTRGKGWPRGNVWRRTRRQRRLSANDCRSRRRRHWRRRGHYTPGEGRRRPRRRRRRQRVEPRCRRRPRRRRRRQRVEPRRRGRSRWRRRWQRVGRPRSSFFVGFFVVVVVVVAGRAFLREDDCLVLLQHLELALQAQVLAPHTEGARGLVDLGTQLRGIA